MKDLLIIFAACFALPLLLLGTMPFIHAFFRYKIRKLEERMQRGRRIRAGQD